MAKKQKSGGQVRLAASLVCADMMNLKQEIKALEQAHVDGIHFDVMDGQFVPRYGLHPEILTALRKLTPLPVDVHMMVDNPEDYIATFAEAGADYFVVHVEACQHLHRTVMKIKEAGMKPGVALNPATPLHVLEPIIDDIDLILLMAINPGILGHKLIPSAMQRITATKALVGARPIEIEIDGGVTLESAAEMVERGATMLVGGSSTIFKVGNTIRGNTAALRKVVDKIVVEEYATV